MRVKPYFGPGNGDYSHICAILYQFYHERLLCPGQDDTLDLANWSAYSATMTAPRLWLLCASLDEPEAPYVIPTVAWMAASAGATTEIYLESERDGQLFAETGSTILGGHHHQQFNYLCARFAVSVIRFGQTQVFDSSISAFGLPIIADADESDALYAALLARPDVAQPQGVFVGPVVERRAPGPGPQADLRDLPAYLYPETFFRRALGASSVTAPAVTRLARHLPVWCASPVQRLAHTGADGARAVVATPVDLPPAEDNLGACTLRIAARWTTLAAGVAFADPAAVVAQLASHCRARRVAVYAPLQALPARQVIASHYTENCSPIAAATASLAVALANRTIVGRQTGDGDIFEWSRQGVSIQIVDPNRPAFPVVETLTHRWATLSPRLQIDDVDDAQLSVWADEGRVLSTLIVHSGEVAHNEAMLALVELSGWSGLKLGVGVHAARYETAPQLWELLQVSRNRGGARGYVEPLLHSGGLGVLAECHCPPPLLRENCIEALERIRDVAGEDNLPSGYYAFMDSNHDRLDQLRPDLFRAIASAGLQHIVSSALPGRNRVLWRDARSGAIALNQTPRVVEGASPFVRATEPHDLRNTIGAPGAGWVIATIDAPVIAFSPYIWREGSRFMALVDALRENGRINVLPRTIARYARLLHSRGDLPAPPHDDDGRSDPGDSQ